MQNQQYKTAPYLSLMPVREFNIHLLNTHSRKDETKVDQILRYVKKQKYSLQRFRKKAGGL